MAVRRGGPRRGMARAARRARTRPRVPRPTPSSVPLAVAPARDAFALLDASGVPCEIADPDFSLGVFDDPEMRARGLVVTQDHPVLGRFDHFGTTIDFSETPGRIWGPPPLVGQHTREIMHEYGFDDDDVDKLIEIGAVFEERRVAEVPRTPVEVDVSALVPFAGRHCVRGWVFVPDQAPEPGSTVGVACCLAGGTCSTDYFDLHVDWVRALQHGRTPGLVRRHHHRARSPGRRSLRPGGRHLPRHTPARERGQRLRVPRRARKGCATDRGAVPTSSPSASGIRWAACSPPCNRRATGPSTA